VKAHTDAVHEPLGVLLVGPDGRIEAANHDLATLTGIPVEDMVGSHLTDVLAEPDGSLSAGGLPTSGFRRIARGPGVGHFVLCDDSRLIDHVAAEGRVVLLVRGAFREAAPHTRDEGQSVRDRLTGLFTRSAFLEELDHLLRHADHAPLCAAVAVLDIDGFRAVSEQYGHEVGDQVLQAIGRRLGSEALSGHLVARLGADEIAVLIPTAQSRDSNLSDALHAAIRRPIVVADHVLHMSASIGQAAVPGDGATADEILLNAGLAMRAAKDAGGDRSEVFEIAMNVSAARRAALRSELAAALRSNGFEVVYQPIIDVRTGAIVAAEGLVRLRRDGDLITAAEWMGVAEAAGFIPAVGLRALELVIDDLHRASTDTPDWFLPIAVNLSPLQLGDPVTLDALATWEVPGGRGRITLEVTESFALPPSGAAMEGLEALRALGYRIAIDDFGSGFSNVAQLDRISPDGVKVDRSLLTNARAPERGRSIYGAVLGLLHTLGAVITSEGVETEADLDLCRDVGVDLAQGNLVGRSRCFDDLVRDTR